MDIGMLWFDNDPKAEIASKIEKAALYYHKKYGKSPTVCYIHPSMLPAENAQDEAQDLKSGNIAVRTSPKVMPNHFWIGMNGANEV